MKSVFSLGYAWPKRFERSIVHAVDAKEGADTARYRLLCTGTPGAYERKGELQDVTCRACVKKIQRAQESAAGRYW